MTVFMHCAAAFAMLVSLGTAVQAQGFGDRSAPRHALYEGRSVVQAATAPSEAQIVMGLRVPGTGPLVPPVEEERR